MYINGVVLENNFKSLGRCWKQLHKYNAGTSTVATTVAGM